MQIKNFVSTEFPENCYAAILNDGIFLVDPGEYTKELSDFMKYGNIKNSVNYPNIELEMESKYRVTIAHQNVPNMLNNFSSLFANENINIINMLNKSKKDNAYTIIDVDAVPADLAEKLNAIDGVCKVRIIEA